MSSPQNEIFDAAQSLTTRERGSFQNWRFDRKIVGLEKLAETQELTQYRRPMKIIRAYIDALDFAQGDRGRLERVVKVATDHFTRQQTYMEIGPFLPVMLSIVAGLPPSPARSGGSYYPIYDFLPGILRDATAAYPDLQEQVIRIIAATQPSVGKMFDFGHSRKMLKLGAGRPETEASVIFGLLESYGKNGHDDLLKGEDYIQNLAVVASTLPASLRHGLAEAVVSALRRTSDLRAESAETLARLIALDPQHTPRQPIYGSDYILIPGSQKHPMPAVFRYTTGTAFGFRPIGYIVSEDSHNTATPTSLGVWINENMLDASSPSEEIAHFAAMSRHIQAFVAEQTGADALPLLEAMKNRVQASHASDVPDTVETLQQGFYQGAFVPYTPPEACSVTGFYLPSKSPEGDRSLWKPLLQTPQGEMVFANGMPFDEVGILQYGYLARLKTGATTLDPKAVFYDKADFSVVTALTDPLVFASVREVEDLKALIRPYEVQRAAVSPPTSALRAG